MRPERNAARARQPRERLTAWAHQCADWSWQRRRLATGNVWTAGRGRSTRSLLVGSVAGLGLVGLVGWGALRLFWHAEFRSGVEALRAGVAYTAAQGHDGGVQVPRHAMQALETAAAVLAGRPKQLALWHLGQAAQHRDEVDRAVAAYQAVVDAVPGDHYLEQLAWLKLGEIAEAAGEPERALSHYTRAAEIDGPSQAQAWLAVAEVFEAAGDHQQAQASYRKFVDTAGNAPLKAVVEYKLDE